MGGGAYCCGLGTACGGGGAVRFLGALNADSPFWGAGVGSFSRMCAFAALRRVLFLGHLEIEGANPVF